MSVTLLSQSFCQATQCCHSWTGGDSVVGHWQRWISRVANFAARTSNTQRHFSELGPVYYARRPCPRPKEHEPLVLCMGGKKGAQNPARPYLKLVS